MNPKIDFLHFQGALLCSFVFHISIECALSDFFWFLLCTHIDHNQISCLRAQIDYESWEFACTMFSCFDCLCTLKIPFCVALITVKSKPLHVSIECAFLDYLYAALYSHCSQSNLITSCFDSVCTLRLLLVVALYSHWSQLYLILSCLDCLCNLRLFRLITVKSCSHCLCTVNWLFCLALYSHYRSQIWSSHASIVYALLDDFWWLLCIR